MFADLVGVGLDLGFQVIHLPLQGSDDLGDLCPDIQAAVDLALEIIQHVGGILVLDTVALAQEHGLGVIVTPGPDLVIGGHGSDFGVPLGVEFLLGLVGSYFQLSLRRGLTGQAVGSGEVATGVELQDLLGDFVGQADIGGRGQREVQDGHGDQDGDQGHLLHGHSPHVFWIIHPEF